MASSIRYVQFKLEKETFLHLLELHGNFHDADVGVHRREYRDDFFGLAATFGLKDYVVKCFGDSDSYTTSYKSYILRWVAEPRMSLDELDLLDFILARGCKSEPNIGDNVFRGCCKMTPLEMFLIHIFRVYGGDNPITKEHFDRVIKILYGFVKYDSAFAQPVYGYFVAVFLMDTRYPLVGELQSDLEELRQASSNAILVDWSLIQVLWQVAHTQTTYFYIQLRNFITQIWPDIAYTPPKIKCVVRDFRGDYWW